MGLPVTRERPQAKDLNTSWKHHNGGLTGNPTITSSLMHLVLQRNGLGITALPNETRASNHLRDYQRAGIVI